MGTRSSSSSPRCIAARLAEQEAGEGAYYVLVDEDGSVLGRFNLIIVEDGVAELGYRVAEHVAGRGVATAAVRDLCGIAATRHGVRRLRAATSTANVASQRVLEKAGFVVVGPADPADIGGKQGSWYERRHRVGGRMARVNDSERNPDVRLNAVGDVILDDVRQLEALADPERLAVFERLQRHGPATTDELAEAMGRDPAAVTASLASLESAGLVRRVSGGWQAPGRGLFLQLPEGDPEAEAAARSLGNVMLLGAADVPARWVADVEPHLDSEWAGAAGLFGASPMITASELTGIQEALEELLEPYLNRGSSDVPAGARKVRLQAFFLPSAEV